MSDEARVNARVALWSLVIAVPLSVGAFFAGRTDGIQNANRIWKVDAVRAGYAEWKANELGEVEWSWLDRKPPYRPPQPIPWSPGPGAKPDTGSSGAAGPEDAT